jgi:hypothetical protein
MRILEEHYIYLVNTISAKKTQDSWGRIGCAVRRRSYFETAASRFQNYTSVKATTPKIICTFTD